jgi:biotin operon repressor
MPMTVRFRNFLQQGVAQVYHAPLRSSKLGLQEKGMYALLCSYAWDGTAYPGHKRLAEESGCSESKVKRSIKVLKDLGLIDIEDRRRQNKTNIYYIEPITKEILERLFPNGYDVKEKESEPQVTYDLRSNMTHDHRSHMTYKEEEVEQQEEKKRASRDCQAKPDETDSKIQEVWSHWENHFRDLYPRMKLTDKRKKAIRARLRSFSVEELKTAIDNISKSPFHRGENEQGQPFAEIERNFRNDEKVEWWLAKKESSPNRRSRKPSAIENAIDETKTQEYLDYITKLEKEREARLAAKKKDKGEDAKCNTNRPLPKFRLMSNSNKR